MKNNKNADRTSQLTPDSQSRLIAYTTAAGLGAFFAGQGVEAQVTQSPAFAPYPATLLPTGGTNSFGYYNFFSIDGGASPAFNLNIGKPFLPKTGGGYYNQFIDMVGQTNGVGQLLGQVLTPTFSSPDAGGHTNNAYLVPFLGGTTINATTASAPWYQPRLEVSYLVPSPYGGFYNYLDSKYITSGALGFSFVGSTDGQTHFGYMDVQVNTTKNNAGFVIVKSVVIRDAFYNATPNAGITIPIAVAIASANFGTNNAVTIQFTSNDNADLSTFTLQTSPALGTAASWVTDTSATISLVTAANPSAGLNQAVYQAVTTSTGARSQFFRIKH